ncbi:MAG: hypothetical protein ACKO2P_11315 [Planctomycetota bacterium]
MDHKTAAVVSGIAVVVSRIADIGSTFYFDPSLSTEANPLVSYFGLGAPGLLAANVIATAILLFALYICARCPPLSSAAAEATTLRDFSCLQVYGRRLSRKEFFTALLLMVPKIRNWRPLLRMAVWSLSWMLSIVHLHHAFSWWALSHFRWDGYSRFRAQTAVWNYPMLEAIGGIVLLHVFAIIAVRWDFQRHLASKAAANQVPLLPDPQA